MNHWLIKSEPFKYSFDDLLRDGKTHWNGVRNFQARNNLRAMKKGDQCLFYHSNEGKEIVGIAEVIREAYPDDSAGEGDWSMVDVKPVKKLKKTVTLADIKAEPKLKNLSLLKQGRLSVTPVSKEDFQFLLKMAS